MGETERESRHVIDLLIEHVLIGCRKEIKQDDSQKSILMDFADSQRVIDFIEQNELSFYFCRMCEGLIVDSGTKFPDELKNTIHDHFASKSHLRLREEHNIKEVEDLCFSILHVTSIPSDIGNEIKKEKEKALKRSAMRLKKQILDCSVSHENASTYPGKEL